MIAAIIAGAVTLTSLAGWGTVRFTLRGMRRTSRLDRYWTRHGHNAPAHISYSPGYELSNYVNAIRALEYERHHPTGS